MVLSIVVVCIGMPLVFVFSGAFSAWLATIGVHRAPNLVGGTPIAEFTSFDRRILDPMLRNDGGEIERAVAIRRFSVKKVAFRRFSGIGIDPRINLVFEFEGKLPDPQNSSVKFSATAIHVYIRAPGKIPEPIVSDRAADVDFGEQGWNYQVIIDGLHEQARVFDVCGNLIANGLGLWVDYTYAPGPKGYDSSRRRVENTTLTAALPLNVIGDPARGSWLYYVLVGVADSRQPTMMLHSADNRALGAFSRAMPPGESSHMAGSRLRLPPLRVSNDH